MTIEYNRISCNSMDKILFVCTGNTCRSAMAEIYFNFQAKKIENFSYYAESAGIHASDFNKISDTAGAVLKNYNIEVPEGFHSTHLNVDILKNSLFVFVMEKTHKEFIQNTYPGFENKTFLISELYKKRDDIDDPIGLPLQEYEQTFLILKEYIDKLIQVLKEDKISEQLLSKNYL